MSAEVVDFEAEARLREQVVEMAWIAHRAGFSVVPTHPTSKRPPSFWKTFQTRLPTLDEVEGWFGDRRRTGLGYICGAVSGGLEVIDFDTREAWDDWRQLMIGHGHEELFERVVDGYSERTPKGMHLFYRCAAAETEGNQKLARGADGTVRVETRANGGFIVVAPTHGDVNPAGPYQLFEGGPATIAMVTDEEREIMLSLARSVDQSPEIAAAVAAEREALRHQSWGNDDDRPGVDFRRRATWAEILEPHGWTRVFTTQDGVTHWRRPGKTRDTSATTGVHGSDYFYVFTTSTVFESERAYNKFSAYAILEHGGDFSRAARGLKAQGYGGGTPTEALPAVDLSAFAQKTESSGDDDDFPKHLLDVPGMVGEFARYLIETAHYPQPLLALGSAIAATGTALGRRVQSESGLRTNVYIAALCESGGGKEWLRKGVRRVFDAADCGRMTAVDGVTSGSAINGLLEEQPTSLLMLDELGHVLRRVRDGGDPLGIVPALLSLYGVADGIYYGTTRAADRRSGKRGTDYLVHQPCLSVFGTTVPRRFWEAIDGGDLEDGFVNRFLVFSSRTARPQYQSIHVDEKRPPHALVERVRAWREWWAPDFGAHVAAALGEGQMAGAYIPEVTVVRSTADARAMLDANRERIDAKIRRLRGLSQGSSAALYSRTAAQAEKLALICAGGRAAPGEARIEVPDAAWGIELASWLTEATIREVADHVGESEQDVRVRQAAAYLRERGAIPKAAFTKRWWRWEPRIRDGVLKTLEESGSVKRMREGDGRKAKEVLVWSDE